MLLHATIPYDNEQKIGCELPPCIPPMVTSNGHRLFALLFANLVDLLQTSTKIPSSSPHATLYAACKKPHPLAKKVCRDIRCGRIWSPEVKGGQHTLEGAPRAEGTLRASLTADSWPGTFGEATISTHSSVPLAPCCAVRRSNSGGAHANAGSRYVKNGT